MNLYYKLLHNILTTGKTQQNKKGNILYKINQTISMDLDELETILAEHRIAKSKLKSELDLYLAGIESVSEYEHHGIHWWDYCAPTLVNSYPTYFKELPALIEKINREKRPSKNYVFYLGANNVITNQQPCISTIQFQICDGLLYLTVFQRSADCNLGLPSDIYHATLIAEMIDVPLANITFFIGNAHIYENNIYKTISLLQGKKVSFELNV